ncbi:MAG: GNAT family N-acetyltransferase [bacterium]|nr:GNAT family N-acetyltransferase [bacterium]
MIVELDRENRASLRRLFGDYPCMHGCIEAVIEDGAGRVFADSLENPSVALAIVDFQFLAGDPFHESVPLLFDLLRAKEWLVVPTPEWEHVVSTTYPGRIEVYQREAFQAEQFDINKLRGFISDLSSGFELRKVNFEDVMKFTELSPAFIASYTSPEDFIDKGVGIGIFHEGKFISGASSSPLGGGKLEFEIQTHRQFRRRGFARIVAAALILYCLENEIEPCWDAAHDDSSALAQQLGFRSTGKYNAFWLPQPEEQVSTA